MKNVIDIQQEQIAERKTQTYAENSNRNAVGEKNPHDLPVRSAERFQQADLFNLVHRESDFGIHDGEGGHDHHHEENDVHHHFLGGVRAE